MDNHAVVATKYLMLAMKDGAFALDARTGAGSLNQEPRHEGPFTRSVA